MEERRSSHELFGYDFVIDESLKAWLIEVNSSPSLEHSTPVTTTLCGDMIDDLFKVGCITCMHAQGRVSAVHLLLAALIAKAAKQGRAMTLPHLQQQY